MKLSCKIILRFFFLLTAFSPSIAFAGSEEVMRSIKGTAIANSSVVAVQDQEYGFIYAHANYVPASKATVVLRFDDSKLVANHDFTLTVNYHITTYDVGGTMVDNNVAGSVNISYNGTGTYTDRAIKIYGVSGTPVHKAVLTIDNPGVTYSGGVPNTVIPNDVFLDVVITTERYYYLDVSTAPVPALGTMANHELPVYWDFVEGTESYDLEWLFIDIGEKHFGSADNVTYDFRNATRINTAENHYNIPLSYPKGILAFRIRSIGIDPSGTHEREESVWSYTTVSGTAALNSLPFGLSYNYVGLDTVMNWQYSAAFAEDGKRKEVINYFDGSLRDRQTSTYLNTNALAVIGETKYDYEGRGTVQVLPTPTTSTGIHYYSNFNPGFDRSNFDTDTKVAAPDAMSTSNGAGKYYSTSNSNQTGVNAFIPDAQGYPYSQTTLMNDGSGRVKAKSGVGTDHKLGSTHETKYFYGTPTLQEELDRLFGNEVGYVNHYKKNMVIDANGQVSVSYLDQYGRVVATALAGSTPSNLLALDTVSPGTQTITGSLLGNNTLTGNNEMVSQSTITVSSPSTTYDFEYTLDSTKYCDGCAPSPTCKACKYDIEIAVYNQDGTLYGGGGLSPNPYPVTNVYEQSTLSFSLTLNVGVYTVVKTVRLNDAAMQQYKTDYINSQTCIDPGEIIQEDCPDCNKLCKESYKERNNDGSFNHYIADDGTTIDSTAADALWRNCITIACTPGPQDPCVLTFKAMKADMSPGGQYFDNLAFKYDASLHLQSGYHINDWLTAELSPATNFWSDFHTYAVANSGVTLGLGDFSHWDAVRSVWDTSMASFLVKYHPEYCAFSFYCGDHCDHTHSEIWDFEKIMQTNTGSNDFWNPLGTDTIPYNNSSNGAGNDNSTYQSYCTANTDTLDPYFALCDTLRLCPTCPASTVKGVMVDMLEHFLPISANTYQSIWYVLDNPDGIDSVHTHGLPASVITAYKQIYNSITYRGMTKYQIFRNYYNFCKDVIKAKEYDVYSANVAHPDGHGDATACAYNHTPSSSPDPGYTKGYLTLGSDPHTPQDIYGFNIYYQQNPVYDNYATLMCGSWTIPGSTLSWCNVGYGYQFQSAIATNLQTYNTTNMASSCATACDSFANDWIAQMQADSNCAMNNTQLNNVRATLKSVCENSYNAGIFYSLDSTRTAVTSISPYHFYTFEQVVHYYDSLYSKTCVAPHDNTTYNQARCSCDNLKAVMVQNGLEATDYAGIAAALDSALHPTVNYTGTDVHNWLDDCAHYSPSQGTLDGHGFPADIKCGTTETSPEPVNILDSLLNQCANESYLSDSINIYNTYNAQVAVAAQAYYNAFTALCMSKLPSKETFTVSYPLNEYNYTLYYYDQAGNLIKTIAPEGVKARTLVSNANLPTVQTTRNSGNAYGSYIWPTHKYVTNYQYNSLNQLTYQFSPDGGESHFWYDGVGRLVASQNAKQFATLPKGYSYTLYDALGRIREVGQVTESADPSASDLLTTASFLSYVGGASARTQVTRTIYDEYISGTINSLFTSGQTNLRNRVATVIYQETYNASNTTYDRATHYSYDIHGNVSQLIQDIDMATLVRTKTDYQYDLVSGNVNEVNYQKGLADEMDHRYYYDADNRITQCYSSTNGVLWEKEAKYYYYDHGPLSRTEIGDKQVQGTDYVYTIHGWIKGVNSTTMKKTRDGGKDGYNNSTNNNEFFAADAYGYSLGYYNGDYKAISNPSVTNSAFISMTNTSNPYNTYVSSFGLFNGNISQMVTSMLKEDETQVAIQGAAYKYDQLNRIRNTSIYRETNSDLITHNYWSSSAADADKYKEEYHYDGNGNITRLKRYDDGGTLVDDLDYTYQTYATNNGYGSKYTNKVRAIHDAVSGSTPTSDLELPTTYSYGSEIYAYDSIGEQTRDDHKEIATINWTVYGKQSDVTHTTSSLKNDVIFKYDAMGNKVVQISIPRTGSIPTTTQASNSTWIYTYYSRDAQGNIMATYSKTGSSSTTINLDERFVYGSSRIGVNTTTVSSINFAASPSTPTSCSRTLGNKQYTLSNHLGNVLVTVSDRKLYMDGNSDNVVDSFKVDVKSYTDYYSFGMAQINRQTVGSPKYRFGFNDKEDVGENEMQEYGARDYDPLTCRFPNVDPLTKKYPELTPYQFASNTPIQGIDLDGKEVGIVVTSMANKPGAAKLGHMAVIVGNNDIGYWIFSVEDMKKSSGYVTPQEKVFQGDVQPTEAKISGSHEYVYYGHKEESWDCLMEYISQNAPGVNNKGDDKGNGYDRIALLKDVSPVDEAEFLKYMQSQTYSDYGTYEFVNNNCSSFSMKTVNGFFGDVVNDGMVDAPNNKFNQIANDPTHWDIYKDAKNGTDNCNMNFDNNYKNGEDAEQGGDCSEDDGCDN